MTFGERIVELRKERGFENRTDFAEYIGIPSTTLRNYETNVREPGHVFLKYLADVFKVSVERFKASHFFHKTPHPPLQPAFLDIQGFLRK